MQLLLISDWFEHVYHRYLIALSAYAERKSNSAVLIGGSNHYPHPVVYMLNPFRCGKESA